jgi:hypothetical protein
VDHALQLLTVKGIGCDIEAKFDIQAVLLSRKRRNTMLSRRRLSMHPAVFSVILLYLITYAAISRASGSWYVSNIGDDGSDCATTLTPCATINEALNRASAGDTIFVATGIYTGSGQNVIAIDKNLNLSGGWSADFSSKTGFSTLDGQSARRVVKVENVAVTLDHFVVQNGYNNIDFEGGGVYNSGFLTMSFTSVISNVSGNTSYSGGAGGAGIYNFTGNLLLWNSSVSNNKILGSFNGNGIMNWGNITLTNVTISHNSGNGSGLYNLGGNISLNNVTLANNFAGGLANLAGSITVRNTIIAQNSGWDCNNDQNYPNSAFNSQGYNIVGVSYSPNNTCALIGSDRTITASMLFPALVGIPGFRPLMPGSPAIDTANPSGCVDELGQTIAIDQRGAPRTVDGNGDGQARCDVGAYELDLNNQVLQSVYLPMVTGGQCAPFYDDFSNPNSGWDVGDNQYVRTDYLNSEYHVLTKQSGYIYLFSAPTPPCNRSAYVVEVDARWAAPDVLVLPGSGYGLIFGIVGDFDGYYLFDVNSDYQQYRLLRRDAGGFTVIVPPTAAPLVIQPTGSNNHLRVTRNGDQIALAINGTTLGTWIDNTYMGMVRTGISVQPYSNRPAADARFDNFSLH